MPSGKMYSNTLTTTSTTVIISSIYNIDLVLLLLCMFIVCPTFQLLCFTALYLVILQTHIQRYDGTCHSYLCVSAHRYECEINTSVFKLDVLLGDSICYVRLCVYIQYCTLNSGKCAAVNKTIIIHRFLQSSLKFYARMNIFHKVIKHHRKTRSKIYLVSVL